MYYVIALCLFLMQAQHISLPGSVPIGNQRITPSTPNGGIFIIPSQCGASPKQNEDDEEVKRIIDKNAPPTYQFRGVILSPTERYMVQPQRSGKGHTATIVAIKNKRRYTMNDVQITQKIYDGSTFHLEPGESDGDYEFHLSPDERWLLVIRRGSNHLFFGTLYHRLRASDTRMALAKTDGARLDEASLQLYARIHHLSVAKIGSGSRYTHFEKWDMKRGVLFFSVAVAPKFEGDGLAWLSAYHFDTGKITIEKEEQY